MSWRLFRRGWVTFTSLFFLALMGFGFLLNYQVSSFPGQDRPAATLSEVIGRLGIVMLLFLGIGLEWLDRTWSAVLVNVGLWGCFGLTAPGKVIFVELTKSPGQQNPEAGLAVAIVGIPCTIVAACDFVLYWITRTGSASH
jgi:hypothetical protein